MTIQGTEYKITKQDFRTGWTCRPVYVLSRVGTEAKNKKTVKTESRYLIACSLDEVLRYLETIHGLDLDQEFVELGLVE